MSTEGPGAPLPPPPVPGPASASPAGWYADPLHPGAWRWWDGGDWTVYTSAGAAAAGSAPRKPRLAGWLSVPVAVCAPLVGLLLVVLAIGSPIALLAALVPVGVVLPALSWLDRVEPEPRAARLHAFLWGATVAVAVALVVNVSVMAAAGSVAGAVVSAPLIEEAMKALGVVIAVRRGEVDGVTDGIVYAGWVGLGFAVVEDVTYFADPATADLLVAVIVLRAVLTPFAHPLFTMWTGLAIGREVRAGRRWWPRALWGYALAVGLHAAWNGSLTLLDGSTALVAAVVLPLFVVLFWSVFFVLRRMRRAEQRRFVAQWPFLSAHYGLTDAERSMLADWRSMRRARKALPRARRSRFDAFHAALARLALLHEQLGQIDPERERLLVDQLTHARAALAE